jgi:hypothetical protein
MRVKGCSARVTRPESAAQPLSSALPRWPTATRRSSRGSMASTPSSQRAPAVAMGAETGGSDRSFPESPTPSATCEYIGRKRSLAPRTSTSRVGPRLLRESGHTLGTVRLRSRRPTTSPRTATCYESASSPRAAPLGPNGRSAGGRRPWSRRPRPLRVSYPRLARAEKTGVATLVRDSDTPHMVEVLGR